MAQEERRISLAEKDFGWQGSPMAWSPAIEYLSVLAGSPEAVSQFRRLREKVEDLRVDNVVLRSIAIVSGEEGDGKSYVAANLAVMFARKKHTRVLLIDGDVVSGKLHVAFGTSNDDGLVQHLRGQRRLSDVIQRCHAVNKQAVSGLENLSFVASGSSSGEYDAADMDVLRAMLQSLGGLYEWIIVDTPSLATGRDGASIARLCDGTLFVAREGVTRFEAANLGLGELYNVVGVVMNGSANSCK